MPFNMFKTFGLDELEIAVKAKVIRLAIGNVRLVRSDARISLSDLLWELEVKPFGNGRTKAMPVETADAQTVQDAIIQNIDIGSMLHTDEAGCYADMGGLFFGHETINHGRGEYVRDGVTTNGIESVFAVMKRGLHGVYHHASPKHLRRYVDEFAFRLNDGNVQRHTLEGAMTSHKAPKELDAIADKVLAYRPKPETEAAKKRAKRARKIKRKAKKAARE